MFMFKGTKRHDKDFESVKQKQLDIMMNSCQRGIADSVLVMKRWCSSLLY